MPNLAKYRIGMARFSLIVAALVLISVSTMFQMAMSQMA